jgi:hypothetical protein
VFAFSEIVTAGGIGKAQISYAAPEIRPGPNDYRNHIEKQRAFLTSRVMDSAAEKRYTLFSIGTDGFSAVSDRSAKGMPLPRSDMPPAERYLFDSGSAPVRAAFYGVRMLLILIIAFAVSYPALRAFGIKRRRSKSAAEVSDKRIAA